MIDLFGLRKQQEPGDEPSPPSVEGGEPVAAPRGSHKLWAFLLVLDSLFVIVFAGTVAAKVYQHWKAPAIAPAPAPRKRPVKTAEAPAPPAAAAPEPAKAPEPAPVEAKPAPDAPRPPKPSMTAEAPRHRETPKPADAGGKTPAPAAAPADGKVKALKTEFKVRAPKAKTVELVGAFIVRGGRRDMSRQDDGTWTVTLYLNPGTYRYFFAIDKKKQLDPENPLSDKGASLLTLP